MNKVLALAALLLPAFAAAQVTIPAEPVYRIMPAPEFEQTLNSAMIPMQPKDAFLGLPACGILDAKTLRAYTLPEAVKVLQPCLAAVSGRYAVSLKGDRGVVGTVKEGRGAVLGIVITAGVTSRVGNSMVRDVQYGISQRGGYLLGFKAVLRSANDPAPAVPSLAQEAIDRCMLPMVVRNIESGADFIKYYGGCLRHAPELKVEDLRPWTGHQMGVILQTDAEGASAEGINGAVTVTGAKGPVTIDLVAYTKFINLP